MTNSLIDNAIEYVVTPAVNGSMVLDSASDLAKNYLNDSFNSKSDMVNSLINWESSKNSAVGFITSLSGALTIPAGIAGDLYASWVYQARMSAAIAYIYGYNLNDERVKTMVLLSILGDACKDALKQVGVEVCVKSAKSYIMKNISGAALRQINKNVGYRLFTKAGSKGIINIAKLVPCLGGVVGGSIDWFSCQTVGRIAKELFAR